MNLLNPLLMIFALTLCFGGTRLNAQNVNIPDANFKTYLLNDTTINTNGDSEIQDAEALAFTGTINCPSLNIRDITGIEAFVNLRKLVCYDNSLRDINVTRNVNLIHLVCYKNDLSDINVSQNRKLSWLHCVNNLISSIDVSQNPDLAWLYCADNRISRLDVTQNPKLTKLYCSTTLLNRLDVTQNPLLERLYCGYTQIDSLDLTQNTQLKRLDSPNAELTFLDIKNGNNTNVTIFDVLNNPNLTCVNVDDVAYSTANWTNINGSTSFSTACDAPIVYIPDASFKGCLLSNAAINTNGDNEIQVTEALAFTGKVDCASMNIADLTGIEAFVNVTKLVCNDNVISSLDVSQNTSLIHLICYKNNLNNLDVSQNTSLSWLHCVNNSIPSLDVSQNTSLAWLYCANNPINSLDVTQNVDLTKLYCSSTQLSSLDVSQNTNLERLYCGLSQISSLDLSQNTSLKRLDCAYAQLNSLNIKNGNNTNVTIFDVLNNPNLSCIEVDDVAYSTANWVDVDPTASFSINCNVPIANGPNNNLRARLADNTQINRVEAVHFKAYPNPTTENITVDFGKIYEEAKIQITNLTGHIVVSKSLENSSTTTLALEGATGVYFANIQTEEGSETLKIIKR